MTDNEVFLSEKEVSIRTGTSPRTWQAYRVRGIGPKYIRLSSRCIRYKWSDVVEWLESNKRSSTSEQFA
jgi:predicted DNA-binding transcriptional regulator AlpA